MYERAVPLLAAAERDVRALQLLGGLSRPVGVLQDRDPEHHYGHREDGGSDGAERQVGDDHGVGCDAEGQVVRDQPRELLHPDGDESLLARQRHDDGHQHRVDDESDERRDQCGWQLDQDRRF